jgi:hypothetical protein
MALVPNGSGGWAYAEQGVPPEYVARGATTVTQYQQLASQDLSDRQIGAQREIADQQQALNEKQFAAQQEQYAQQQQQVDEQAARQSQYDTGRAAALAEGTQAVEGAFSKFSPVYFQQYARDYMTKAQDQIDYQKRDATKNLGFALARQGISSSQAGVNQTGLIDETAGRAAAEQTALAQTDAANRQAQTAAAKQNLLTQVGASQSIGSPIAGSSVQDIENSLQTQRNAISGITSSAGDVTASLNAVPTVNTLGSIFSGVLGGAGNLLGGIQAGQISGQFNKGLAGTNPGGSSTRID